MIIKNKVPKVLPIEANIIYINSGSSHHAAISENNEGYLWGNNTHGQCNHKRIAGLYHDISNTNARIPLRIATNNSNNNNNNDRQIVMIPKISSKISAGLTDVFIELRNQKLAEEERNQNKNSENMKEDEHKEMESSVSYISHGRKIVGGWGAGGRGGGRGDLMSEIHGGGGRLVGGRGRGPGRGGGGRGRGRGVRRGGRGRFNLGVGGGRREIEKESIDGSDIKWKKIVCGRDHTVFLTMDGKV